MVYRISNDRNQTKLPERQEVKLPERPLIMDRSWWQTKKVDKEEANIITLNLNSERTILIIQPMLNGLFSQD